MALSPLYSDNSAFRKGVRFKGFLSMEGMFVLDAFDTKPFFGKSYSKKFKCDLRSVVLAPLESSPVSRLFDFKWDGALQFPFFSNAELNTWRPVRFEIKDADPFMPLPINIERTSGERLQCSNGELTNLGTGTLLSLTVNKLNYIRTLGGFVCDSLKKNDTGVLGRLELFSYSHALFIEKYAVKKDTVISQTVTSGCNNNRTVTEFLKDAYPNSVIIDLVCYDRLASAARDPVTNNSSCCSVFYYGTYQIITQKGQGTPIVTLSANNAKFYPYESTNKLKLENSTLTTRSDDTSEGETKSIEIPGMQLAYNDQGYFGAFGSTYTDVAFSLPYEGEFRFFLDPKCGYFYMLGAGSFTIFGIPLRGQVFLFHAQRSILDAHPFSSNTSTTLLEDMRIRSLSSDIDAFLSSTQLKGMNPGSVITGFLSTGAASYGLNFLGIDVFLQAGVTNYLYHTTDNNAFKTGMFEIANASASLDLKLFSVGINGRIELEQLLSIPVGNNAIASFRGTDLTLSGRVQIEGCIDVLLLGKCCAGIRTGASMSTQTGLKIDPVDPYACCDCDD
jgi:hypothetical protein